MIRPSRSSVPRSVLAGSAALMLLIGLAACTDAPSPEPSTSPSASPTASVTPTAPALVPDGSAEDNLPLFTAVADSVWATGDKGAGRAYVDALVEAGFDRSAMQVTQDASTVGNPAESLQFSVRWGTSECLIGQVGPSTGQVVTAVMPQLAEGRCLIGTTRAIDW
ncbi:MAG: hypothetical protein P0Y60_10145 [Candidatus Microbacterium colombiense]|nr:MAG: hypothetical protein P0Y60_10145 [Microbacterium sp.]